MTAPVPIVHRLPADPQCITALAAAGAGGFELDVQLRGDTVVVSHFLPFLQLPGWFEHDGTHFRWRGGPPKDRTLAQALAQLPRSALVVLDPKEQRAVRRRRLAGAVAAANLPRDRVVVTTGRPDELTAYRAAGLRTWRTLGTEQQLAATLASRDRPLAEGVAVRHELLDGERVRRLLDIAPRVTAWTVDDADRARQLIAWGVGAVTTDNPAVVAAVAGAR